MTECRKRSDWDKWKVTIETEIALLNKKEGIFGSNANTSWYLPRGIQIGFRP